MMKLKVTNEPKRGVNWNQTVLSSATLDELGIDEDEIVGENKTIKIAGTRGTTIRVGKLNDDETISVDEIPLNGYVRQNAEVQVGEYVTVTPVSLPTAERVYLSIPLESGNSPEELSKPNVNYNSITPGDIIPGTIIRKGGGPQKIPVEVIDTIPSGPVIGPSPTTNKLIVVVLEECQREQFPLLTPGDDFLMESGGIPFRLVSVPGWVRLSDFRVVINNQDAGEVEVSGTIENTSGQQFRKCKCRVSVYADDNGRTHLGSRELDISNFGGFDDWPISTEIEINGGEAISLIEIYVWDHGLNMASSEPNHS